VRPIELLDLVAHLIVMPEGDRVTERSHLGRVRRIGDLNP